MIFLSLLGLTFMMGFYGSWHCGAMCGPITLNFKNRNQFWIMQLTRLVSYLLMTVLVFSFASFFRNSLFDQFKWVASVVIGGLLIAMGIRNYFGGRPTPDLLAFFMKRFSLKSQKKIFSSPALIGILMGLFPCGWFYSFLLLTPQLSHFYQALLLMTVFWSTSLPALMAFRGVVLKIVKESPERYHKAASLILVLAGILSILGHWAHQFIPVY